MKEIALDISSLDKRLDNLSMSERTLFQRLYTLNICHSQMVMPDSMNAWAIKQFGSLEAVLKQRIVRLTNNITGEETIFNSIRALRPSDTREKIAVSLDSLDTGADSFAIPEETTPEDVFGRIRGKHCITASNIAKCDELHGVVVFKNFHPLKWGREEVADYIDTAWEWAQAAHTSYPSNKYFFFCWNCLWRSGASINHGHAQVMLSRGRAHSRIETLRKAAQSYRRKYGSNYFDDLFYVHKSLGLAFDRNGVRVIAYLTPVKNREIILMAERLDVPFKTSVYDILSFYRDRLGVTSFNLAIATPPLDKTRESWQGFPVIAWGVDRGRLEYRSSDIGSLELFAANFVTGDPFELAEALGSHFKGREKMPDAVLVVDMLRGFLEKGNPLYCGVEARQIIPKVVKLLDEETKKGSKIFFIADCHAADDLEFEMFPPHCIAGSPQSELIPELRRFAGKTIPKQRYSAFFNTQLEMGLRKLKPEKIIVCGVCTDICVMHTVADARNRDYPVEVPADCVASFDAEAHKWALEHMQKVLGARLTLAKETK